MVFLADDGKDSEAGKDSEIGYYEEIIKTSSVIPTCFLHDHDKDKGLKSVEKEENAQVAWLRSRRGTYKKLSLHFMLHATALPCSRS